MRNGGKIVLSENKDRKRFEFVVEGKVSFVEYIRLVSKIYLTHTEVARELEGKGLGSILIRKVLDQVRKENLKLIPLCPFVASYLKKHHDYQSLIA